ncbi:MAG: hypothetical protein MI924_13060 [Chloroflexales bacterium]|nr:hypothetical protein [Chloroflexales bacterium]
MKVRLLAMCILLMGLAWFIPSGRTMAAPTASQFIVSKTAPSFQIVAEAAVFNPITRKVRFMILFNQPPDFFTVDEYGRQAHSFQYFIIGDPDLPYPEKYDSIIRGGEIHITGNMIRIRNATPYSNDPGSGGWGTLRGVVPYYLHGNLLTFSVPLDVLSDSSLDGRFAYHLQSCQFGASTKLFKNHTIVRP